MADETAVVEEEKKSGGAGGLIVLVIIILMLGGFVALVKFDVFGLGTNVLGPSLKDVPVLNLILPEMPEEEVDADVVEIVYTFETVEEAIEIIKERDKRVKELEEMVENNSEANTALEEEVARLKVFEDNQVAFEADKLAFDQLVAEQADPASYMTYVEGAYPETALSIYEQFAKDSVMDEDIQKNADMYGSMKAKEAATIMEITHLSDMEMVSEILQAMDTTKAGSILAAMDPTIADRISRYMYPNEDQ